MSYLVERREEERERRRGEILSAAEELYAQVGWDAVTMDRVARSARLSRALLYVYFHDKEDLLLALSAQALHSLRDRFRTAAASQTLGIDKVEAIGRAYVAWALETPHLFDACARFQARPPAGHAPARPEENLAGCEAAGNSVLGEVAAAVHHGFADGTISKDVGDPALFAISLWGCTHGVIQVAIGKGEQLERLGLSADALYANAFALLRLAMTPKG